MHSTNKPHHPKASKAVLERQKTSRHLLATLEALDSPTKTTTTAPIPTALLHGLAPGLHHSITELVMLDEKVFTHRAQLTQVRQQRDKALRQLAHDVAQLRLSIENQYKTPEIEDLGFESPTPRSPQPLLRVATRVAKNLAHPDLPHRLGPSWFANPFDPTTHQDELTQQIKDLRHLLHQVDTLQRDLDQARIRRQQAQRDHDLLTRETRQIIASVERLGHLAEHQARSTAPRQPEDQASPGYGHPVARILDPAGVESYSPGLARRSAATPSEPRVAGLVDAVGPRFDRIALRRFICHGTGSAGDAQSASRRLLCTHRPRSPPNRRTIENAGYGNDGSRALATQTSD